MNSVSLSQPENFFITRSICPLCKTPSDTATKIFNVVQIDTSVKVLKCSTCGLLYKEQIPSNNLMNLIYSTDYVHYVTEQQKFPQKSPRIKRLGKPKGRLLDYGCGSGAFVLDAKDAGWDAYGCDPFLPEEILTKHHLGLFHKLDASKDEIFSLGKFDTICMWAVVEHLNYTPEVFKNLSRMLNTGGTLIFNSPWGGSVISKKQGSNWAMSILVEHLQFHTQKSIEYISKINNLKISSIRYCGSPYPFGKSSPLNQGVPDALLNTIPENLANQALQLDSNQNFDGLKRYLLKYIDSSNSQSILGWLARSAIHLLRIGDHIEIRLTKN